MLAFQKCDTGYQHIHPLLQKERHVRCCLEHIRNTLACLRFWSLFEKFVLIVSREMSSRINLCWKQTVKSSHTVWDVSKLDILNPGLIIFSFVRYMHVYVWIGRIFDEQSVIHIYLQFVSLSFSLIHIKDNV